MPSRPSLKALTPLLYFPLFGLLLAAFWDQAVIHRDSFQLFAPYKFLIAQALRRGEVWAWQPWTFLGLPFIAEPQSSWFYPLNLFYLLLPFRSAHNLYILVHLPMAAAFMHLFLRGRGRSEAAAAFGALVFSLSGYLVHQHATVTMLIGPALAPLVLYGFDRALKGGSAAAVGAGAALALQFFGGDVQAVVVTAAGLCVWTVAVAARPGSRRRAATALAVAGGSALLFSAVQLLPTLELMRLSSREGGLPLAQAQIFNLHPWRLIELFWPNPFGQQWPEVTWWGESFALEGLRGIAATPWSLSNYLGLPAVALAHFGALGRPRRERLLLLAATVFFLLLALGPHTPLYGLCYRWVPLFHSFRFPEKFMAWFTLAVAVLAAGGFDDLLVRQDKRRLVISLGLFLFNLSVFSLAMEGRLRGLLDLLPANDPRLQPGIENIGRGWEQMLAVAAVCTAAGIAAVPRPQWRRAAFCVFLSAVVLDLWSANVRQMPRGPGDIWDFPPLAARALPAGLHSRLYRLPMTFRDRNPTLAGLPRAARLRLWQRNTLADNLQAMSFVSSPGGYNPIEFASDRGLLFDGVPAWLLPRLGVEHVLANFGATLPDGLAGETVAADPANDFTLYRLDRFLPRAYFVGRAVPADRERWPEQLRRGDPYQTVYIDGLPATEGTVAEFVAPEFVVDEPDRVEVKVAAPGAGWLVLLDRFYPGWEARVDGRPARIYRANGMVRAVRVPAGSHRVSFDYRPTPLRAGAAVSVMAWLLAAALAIGRGRGKKKDSTPSIMLRGDAREEEK